MELLRKIKSRIIGYDKIDAIVKYYHEVNSEKLQKIHDYYIYSIERDYRQKAVLCKETGILREKYLDSEVIVSLTTYGKRIYDVCLAIESIMQGTLLPNKIILWLSDKEFSDDTLPLTIKNQQKRGLSVKYTRDIKSYKKIIPTLRENPNSIVVTIDDDVIYDYDMLEKLIVSYKKDPLAIHANMIHNATMDSDGIMSYTKWEHKIDNTVDTKPTYFMIGVGGVLYPPCSLDSEVLNEDVFMEICPNCDDIWLKAMALKKGTKILKAYTHSSKGADYVELLYPKEEGLWIKNYISNDCRNDKQLNAVFQKYDLYKFLK